MNQSLNITSFQFHNKKIWKFLNRVSRSSRLVPYLKIYNFFQELGPSIREIFHPINLTFLKITANNSNESNYQYQTNQGEEAVSVERLGPQNIHSFIIVYSLMSPLTPKMWPTFTGMLRDWMNYSLFIKRWKMIIIWASKKSKSDYSLFDCSITRVIEFSILIVRYLWSIKWSG